MPFSDSTFRWIAPASHFRILGRVFALQSPAIATHDLTPCAGSHHTTDDNSLRPKFTAFPPERPLFLRHTVWSCVHISAGPLHGSRDTVLVVGWDWVTPHGRRKPNLKITEDRVRPFPCRLSDGKKTAC